MSPNELRTLPKVELHRHLEGTVRYETYCVIAREAGVTREPRSALRIGPRDPRSLRAFLTKFRPLRGLYPSRRSIERVARECIEDAARDRIEYLELRFSPAHFARRMDFDGAEVAEWVIEAARREARRHGMRVNFLITVGRDYDLKTNAPSMRAALARIPGVVGVDVAGLEKCSLDHLGPFLKLARRAGLHLTIHAGEDGPGRNVLEAVHKYGAERIGHGVRFRGRLPGVAFEFCLTSNRLTGACRSIDRHPLRRHFDEGTPVSLNTDDPALCGIDLTGEYELAARRLHFTLDEFHELNHRALASAFL